MRVGCAKWGAKEQQSPNYNRINNNSKLQQNKQQSQQKNNNLAVRRQKQQYIYNKHTTYYSARARATTIFQNGVLDERLLRNIFRRAIAPSRPATIKNICQPSPSSANHSATGDRRSCDHQKTPQLFVSLWAIAIIAAVTGKIISAVTNVFCSIFPKGNRTVAAAPCSIFCQPSPSPESSALWRTSFAHRWRSRSAAGLSQ